MAVVPNADYFLSGSEYPGVYKIEAENVGTTATSGEVVLTEELPVGLSAKAVRFYLSSAATKEEAPEFELPASSCATTTRCAISGSVRPGEKLTMASLVPVPASLEGQLLDSASITGGGAPAAQASTTNAASADPPFGLLHLNSALTDSAGSPYTQAGGHPYQLTTEFDFETVSEPSIAFRTDELSPDSGGFPFVGTQPFHDPKEITAELPPGLLANPQAVPHCSLADYFSETCARTKDAVGSACIRFEGHTEPGCWIISPVFNLQPQGSYPGELGILIGGAPFVVITAGLRSGSDYGVSASNLAPAAALSSVRLTLWGVPADESHDLLRGKECQFRATVNFNSVSAQERRCEGEEGQGHGGGPAGVPPTPFLTSPTECSNEPLDLVGRYNTWDAPSEYAESIQAFPPVDGCNALHFEPSIEAQPTTNLADSASGLEFDLHVPQNEDPEGVSTPSLKEAVVMFPAGLSVNPSSGAGLQGCSPAQVGLATPVGQVPAHFTEAPAQCPDAAKLGTVEVKTPLLHAPLDGALYLAAPHQNPFGALLAGYIVLEGEGLIIKLPGQFQADPQSGQITASFLENPQTPFEDFRFDVFGGARGALRTPAVCGTYETTSTLTPYSAPESGPAAEPSAEFETSAGPGGEGSPCAYASPAEEPNQPLLRAGTESPQAGVYSPFSLKLVRQDGEQEIKQIETTLPPGLVGKLAGVGECPEAALAAAAAKSGAEEQASPSCPAASELGSVDVASGAGPTPLHVAGKAYLAGPYKSAPLSLAIITPAVAGPFDLGDVLVRTALYVNPETAQITARSDPIPTILEGIPLDVRQITLQMARPEFTLNPTNCEALAITGNALSVQNLSAPLAQRFQVGGCPALAFKPKLSLSLSGATHRTGDPKLKAVLTMKPGQANIAKAQVTLPRGESIDNAHVSSPCTRVQFAGPGCPPSSAIGFARAQTPLLDHPLEGPVYLMTGFGHTLPDVAADLNGQIRVLLHGKVDTVHQSLRNTFEVVPDAPVTRFTLTLDGGKKGLIENQDDICASPRHAIAAFTGQNGKLSETTPRVRVRCGGRGKKGGGHGHKGHH